MRHARYLVLLVAVLMLAGAGCEQVIELLAPEVEYEARKHSGSKTTLVLTWDEVDDAEGYKVIVDGGEFTTEDLTFEAEGPAKEIQVLAYAGSSEGDAWKMDFSAMVTENVMLWGKSDSGDGHTAGFGFGATGCEPYAIWSEGDQAKIDFVLDDDVADTFYFLSGNEYDPILNEEDNGAYRAETGDFAAEVNAPDAEYMGRTAIEAGAVYYLWLDPDRDGWDADRDHFAKVSIETIDAENGSVLIKTAYQKVPGLTWLKTD